MPYKTIAGLIPTIQAVHLTNYNIKKATKKKPTTKDMLELGVGNIVGISLIKVESDLIASL